MASVLLTGGAGYIGSHTALAFLEQGIDVVVADNFCNSQPEAIRRVERLAQKEIKVYEADVCDRAAMRRIFEENPTIDAVVHFAGLKAVGESVKIPLEYYRNNIDSALVVCEMTEAFGVHKIVFSSSATVYGASTEVPLTEDSTTGCTSPYGWTKYMIEQILRDYANANKQLEATLLRYFNPVGAHPSGMIGEDPKGIPNNLMPYVCQVAVGRLAKLNVYGNDYPTSDGTGVRDYIHVVDLAQGHVAAYLKSKVGVNVYNLGTGRGSSVLEVIHAFEEAAGVKIPYEITARRPGDVAICYADPKRANEELGWRAQYDLRDMCRDGYNWQRKNPNGYLDAQN
ncbi:MAG: UDP-glucose 4-epimerase GalE [Planctomycetia bacterium]|nr:UDP-glucose 4-epimerase GalE [Planctomycetia bacterium]